MSMKSPAADVNRIHCTHSCLLLLSLLNARESCLPVVHSFVIGVCFCLWRLSVWTFLAN